MRVQMKTDPKDDEPEYRDGVKLYPEGTESRRVQDQTTEQWLDEWDKANEL